MSAPRRLLICGATSAIASAAARCSAASHDRLFLVGRDPEKLGAVADDLRVRGAAQVETYVADLNDIARHQALIDECTRRLGGFDTVLVAHGTLPDQTSCQESFDATRAELDTNFMSVVSLLTRVSKLLRAAGRRHDRGHFLGCRRSRSAEQLRLRDSQGSGVDISSGAPQSAPSPRGSRDHHQAGIRRYSDDRGFPEEPALGRRLGGREGRVPGPVRRRRCRVPSMVLATDHAVDPIGS